MQQRNIRYINKAPTKANIKNRFQHLTNYSVNKYSKKFKQNEGFGQTEEKGHKRSMQWFFNYLRQQGRDSDGLWREIKRICLKSLCAVQPVIKHYYQSLKSNDYSSGCCFQVLGFDIIVSENLKPYVLEVNSSPSFGTDSPLDLKIKSGLVRDTFRLVDLSHKRKMEVIKNERIRLAQRMVTGKRQKVSHKERLKRKVKLIKRIERKMEEVYGGLGNFERVFGVQDYIEAGLDTSQSVLDLVKSKKSTEVFASKSQSGSGADKLKKISGPRQRKLTPFQKRRTSIQERENISRDRDSQSKNRKPYQFNKHRRSVFKTRANCSVKKHMPQSVKNQRGLLKSESMSLFKGFTEDMQTEAKCFGFMAFAEMFEKRAQFKRGRKSDIEDLLLLTNNDFNTENAIPEKENEEKNEQKEIEKETSRENQKNQNIFKRLETSMNKTNSSAQKGMIRTYTKVHGPTPRTRGKANSQRKSRILKKFKSCGSLKAAIRVPMRCEKEAFGIIFQAFLKKNTYGPEELSNICPMVRRLFELLKFLSDFENGKDVNGNLHLLADFRWKRICFCRLCSFLTKIERENEFVFVKLRKFLRFYKYPKNKPYSSRESGVNDGGQNFDEITKSFTTNMFQSNIS